MKRFLVVLILAALIKVPAPGAVPVIDFSVLGQVVENVRLATEQLEQLRLQVERMGDPEAVPMDSATAVRRSLAIEGVGKTLEELRAEADGAKALRYDGSGLYRPPGEWIETEDGQRYGRATEPYRQFDALTRAKTSAEDVIRQTDDRRKELRRQIDATVRQLQSADTLAEIEKLQGVLIAQNSEIGAIDREREAALGRVVVQQVENESDASKQEKARREERVVDFRRASERLAQFLTPDTAPVRVPDPRQRIP